MLDPSMRFPPDWRCLDARRSSARVWRAKPSTRTRAWQSTGAGLPPARALTLDGSSRHLGMRDPPRPLPSTARALKSAGSSRFQFSLNLRSAFRTPSPPLAFDLLIRGSASRRRSRREATSAVRVLIVEDNADIGGLLVDFAPELGHPADLAPSAGAALTRPRVQLPVQVSEYGSVDWLTTSVDLSPSGMKVRPLWAAPESAVRLSVTLPDDGERLEIVSVLIRVDLDGYAFYFTNLTGPQLERLTRLINRLSAQPTP